MHTNDKVYAMVDTHDANLESSYSSSQSDNAPVNASKLAAKTTCSLDSLTYETNQQSIIPMMVGNIIYWPSPFEDFMNDADNQDTPPPKS
jgi:hypothetical protein